MKDILYAIQDLFVDVLFIPLDAFRDLELENWWLANIISWVFVVISFVAFIYWMKQLKTSNDNNEENKTITAHDYL
ncbi:uracil phosphoribosyltransferase [Mariniflexile ostreae]|uniref:Uracil phosphoribosyltransferase n=1 Tax=Mariniflexile ostreae TaxID=1520892 RepID=A0ABV5F749_9FLAO